MVNISEDENLGEVVYLDLLLLLSCPEISTTSIGFRVLTRIEQSHI